MAIETNNNNRKRKNSNFVFHKNNDYGTKKPEARIPAPEVCAGIVEYKMGKVMADNIIKNAPNKQRKPQEILCDYVNTECGLKGFCVKVLVDLQ